MEWVDALVGGRGGGEVKELLVAVGDKKVAFIRDYVMRELLERGGEALVDFLAWLAVYRRPVKAEGVRWIAEKAGLETVKQKELLRRGMALSLIEHDNARETYRVTPLLREQLFQGPGELSRGQCHEAAFGYYKEVCDGKSGDRFDPILVEEWVHHALGCGEEDVAARQGERLVNYLRESLASLESRRVGLWVLEQKKRQLATEHDGSLLNALAVTTYHLGGHREAIGYYQEVLTIWKEVYGETHQQVAIVLNNLGAAWKELGDHRKAIGYFEQALTIWKEVYGETHQQVAIALNNLGVAWDDLGDKRKAIGYYQEALTIDEAVFGRRHPNVARDLNNLGAAWFQLEQPERAKDHLEEAYAILNQFFGPEHPNTKSVAGSLEVLKSSK
ncbi:MAG: tetratricopeptide repeat protein [bacterium]|nr:tetratricopeptide repeat protein [bacterium]